jgi:hypothetical protein
MSKTEEPRDPASPAPVRKLTIDTAPAGRGPIPPGPLPKPAPGPSPDKAKKKE